MSQEDGWDPVQGTSQFGHGHRPAPAGTGVARTRRADATLESSRKRLTRDAVERGTTHRSPCGGAHEPFAEERARSEFYK